MNLKILNGSIGRRPTSKNIKILMVRFCAVKGFRVKISHGSVSGKLNYPADFQSNNAGQRLKPLELLEGI